MDEQELIKEIEKYKKGFITLPDVGDSLRVFVFHLREQIAKENEELQTSWKCNRTHPAGMESCDYCSGFLDGLEVSANLVRNPNV